MQRKRPNKFLFIIIYLAVCFLPWFVNAQSGPVITATTPTGNIYSCTGTASADPDIGQFTVSGINLTDNITAAAPAGFEVSLAADDGYANSVILNQSGGFISNVKVFVRLAASATTGTNAGNVTLTSGTASINVAVNGDAATLPTVDPVPSQTVTYGQLTTAIKFTGTSTAFEWTNDNPSIGLPAKGTGDIAAFRPVNPGTTPVTATITVTGQPNEGYAYIANEFDNTVSIINTSTLQLVPNYISIEAPLGVAVTPDGQRVYVSSLAEEAAIINTANNEKINDISDGNTGWGIAASPDNKKVYVSNPVSNSITVIDAASSYTSSIPLGRFGNMPETIALSPDGSLLYVCNEQANEVTVVSTTDSRVLTYISFNDLSSNPYDLAASPDGKTMYANSGFFDAINVASNMYTSTSLGDNLTTTGMCLSPDGNTAYIAVNQNTVALGYLIVYNIPSNKIIATVSVGYAPTGVSITPDGHYVYVCNTASNSVSIINAVSNTVVTTLAVGRSPVSMGNFIKAGSNCNSLPVSFTITVNPDTTGPQVAVHCCLLISQIPLHLMATV